MVSIIAAVAENGVIGNNNSLLWHIAEDMRYFRHVTTGHPVIMGRKTYESLGRPLPRRENVVVTRQELAIPGCRVVHSLGEALALFDPSEELFVIGGAQLYAAALPPYEGDTRFPAWDEGAWRLVRSEAFAAGAEYPYPFAFELYERR